MKRSVISSPLRVALIALASAALAGAHAKAEGMPNPHQIASPHEQEAAAEVTDLLLGSRREPAQALRRLDQILARLERPTALRGLVQYLRASALLALRREENIREPLEESIRLLPGYSGPLLMAVGAEAYADRPEQAVGYLLRASEIDPAVVRRIPDYEVRNLRLRLNGPGDSERMAQLAERLFAIGWLGEDVSLRSSLALDLIEAKLARGDTAGAQALLPRLLSPEHVRQLLAQRRFRSIWPLVEQWAGPRQESLWQTYLAELRARWRTSRDPAQALPYVRALESANHDETIVREMLPAFSRRLDPRRDYELVWIVAPLAGALARLGRWQELDAMFARAEAAWPLGRDANALNVTANRARYRLAAGDAEASLRDSDNAIADSARRGGQVSRQALAGMHQNRVCALHEMGRDSEALSSVDVVLSQSRSPIPVARMYLCLDRHEEARNLLIGALRREGLRDEVILFVQRDRTRPMDSDWGREIHARESALRADPALLAAVARHGRILPDAVGAGAPAELRERPEGASAPQRAGATATISSTSSVATPAGRGITSR